MVVSVFTVTRLVVLYIWVSSKYCPTAAGLQLERSMSGVANVERVERPWRGLEVLSTGNLSNVVKAELPGLIRLSCWSKVEVFSNGVHKHSMDNSSIVYIAVAK
jgi:hypothetical protein